ncbi:MAG: dihydroorotase family protein [bacterium]
MVDLVIKNGQVVFPGEGVRRVHIAVHEGTIAGLCSDNLPVGAAQVIDADGLWVMPGAIDGHVHCGNFLAYEDDIQKETQSAAIGGVTTIVNYFKGDRSFHETVPGWIDTASQLSTTDYAFHLQLLTNQQLAEVPEYVERYGVTSFKINMVWRGITQKVFGTDREVDDGFILAVMEKLVSVSPRLLLLIHCENVEIRRQRIAELKGQGEDTLAFLERLSPDFAETESVYRTLYLAHITGARVFLVHLSAGSSVDALTDVPWTLAPGQIVAETCPHYLVLDMNAPAGLKATVSPPIRTAQDSDRLWDGIARGLITVAGSDTNPRRLEEKMGPDVWSVKPGFGGVGLLLPLMISEGYHRRGLPLETIVNTLTKEPAKAYNLYPKKGSLEVGTDADLVLVDPELEKQVTTEMLMDNSDFCIYEGMKIKGWPVLTLSRGVVIARDGQPVVQPGHGEYLFRQV